MLFLLSMVFHH